MAGEIGRGNYNYYFFIPQALLHSDDISIITHMLRMIIIQALEDAGEVHTGNDLQYIKNSPSQTFLSSLISMCLILSVKKIEYEISVTISLRFDSYKTIFEQKMK